MKKIVIAISFCLLLIPPVFATELPTILLGLRWSDSEEIVHKKMQELKLDYIREKS